MQTSVKTACTGYGTGKSCLREVLVDLNQTVTVEWLGKDGFQVLYPAFFEEAVENTPARIIETHTHGVGIQYRNAFRNTISTGRNMTGCLRSAGITWSRKKRYMHLPTA